MRDSCLTFGNNETSQVRFSAFPAIAVGYGPRVPQDRTRAVRSRALAPSCGRDLPAPEWRPEVAPADPVPLHQLADGLRRGPGGLGHEREAAPVAAPVRGAIKGPGNRAGPPS